MLNVTSNKAFILGLLASLAGASGAHALMRQTDSGTSPVTTRNTQIRTQVMQTAVAPRPTSAASSFDTLFASRVTQATDATIKACFDAAKRLKAAYDKEIYDCVNPPFPDGGPKQEVAADFSATSKYCTADMTISACAQKLNELQQAHCDTKFASQLQAAKAKLDSCQALDAQRDKKCQDDGVKILAESKKIGEARNKAAADLKLMEEIKAKIAALQKQYGETEEDRKAQAAAVVAAQGVINGLQAEMKTLGCPAPVPDSVR